MKPQNKWIAAALIAVAATTAIVSIEKGEKPKTLPIKPNNTATVYILPEAAEIPTTASPLLF